MQIVILCGGRGLRLNEITKKTSKPMLLFNGKPFLERVINFLNTQGFDDFLLLVGYQYKQIIEHFKNKKISYKIDYSIEKKLLGTGGAVINAKKKLKNNFILLNGDSFLPENYTKILKKFKEINKDLLITVYKEKSNHEFKNNIYIKKKKLKRYSKSNNLYFNYVDAGVYVVKKSLIYKQKKRKFSFEKYFFQNLIDKNKIGYIETKKFFYDIGTKSKLTKYRKKLKSF